jgi:hypothetical protein
MGLAPSGGEVVLAGPCDSSGTDSFRLRDDAMLFYRGIAFPRTIGVPVPPVCSNCGANDFVWANDLKTGSLGGGTLSLRSRGELAIGTRICKSCGHADLFLRDPSILRMPHTWKPGEFVPIPPTPVTSGPRGHSATEPHPSGASTAPPSPPAAPLSPPPSPSAPPAPPAASPPPPPPPSEQPLIPPEAPPAAVAPSDEPERPRGARRRGKAKTADATAAKST